MDHRFLALSPALSPAEVGFWDLDVINLFSRSIRIIILEGKSFFIDDNDALSP